MSPILRYFDFDHLPAGPLRKLLEGKDAAVRAALDVDGNDETRD